MGAVRKALRNNLTDVEKVLWQKLRRKQLGYMFRRQFSIGNYVVDFYCPERRLVVELDGGQHNDEKQIEYDRLRSRAFKELDIRVIRFWNNNVLKDIDTVLQEIDRWLNTPP